MEKEVKVERINTKNIERREKEGRRRDGKYKTNHKGESKGRKTEAQKSIKRSEREKKEKKTKNMN